MTASRRPARHRLVPLLVVPVLLAGCGESSPEAPTRSLPSAAAPGAAMGAAAVQTRAAELEAGLTAVLVERTYAQATAAATRSAPALAALDASSVALVDVLAAPTEERARLLTALRDCDARQLAAAAPDAGAAQEAALATCRTQLDEAVRRTVPRLSVEQVEGRLAAAPGGSPAATRAAAATARGTARVLAGAIAADRRLGATATPASSLRADLTWLLVEHAALATSADGSPEVAQALTANGDELGALLGRSYPRLRRPVREAWNAHLDRLATFSTAVQQGQVARSLTLRTSVVGLSSELGPLLAGSVRGLSAPRLGQELAPALEALVAAVEAAELGRPEAATLRSEAAAAFLPTAALVSGAVAEDRGLA